MCVCVCAYSWMASQVALLCTVITLDRQIMQIKQGQDFRYQFVFSDCLLRCPFPMACAAPQPRTPPWGGTINGKYSQEQFLKVTPKVLCSKTNAKTGIQCK